MEIKVTVVHELGASVAQFINAFANAGAAQVANSQKVSTSKAQKEEAEEEPVAETTGRARRGSKAKEEEAPAATGASRRRGAAKKEEPAKEVAFVDLDEADQLKEIMKVAAALGKKKGGGEDVREMLGVYDAGKTSELDPKDYVEFYTGLERYKAGESIDDIYPEQD